MNELRRVKRLRWGVRATLTLGVAASVSANVLHARPNPISQAIAAWPPIALLMTVELVSRIPAQRPSLALTRIVSTSMIAGIAAWVSYLHMTSVAARYGETGPSPYLLPLSVDGLIVIASVCLLELTDRINVPAPNSSSATTTTTTPQITASTTASTTNRAPKPIARSEDPPPPNAQIPHPPHDTTPDPPKAVEPNPYTGEHPTDENTTTAYQPVSDEDAAMYQAWQRGVAAGRRPTGAELAHAVGRANDDTGLGRKAARRYRHAHPPQAPNSATS